MRYINFVNKLILGAIGVIIIGIFTACEQEFYKDEQYRKEIFLVSGDENIFAQEFAFGEEVVGYLSIYAGGTTSINKEVIVQLAKDENMLPEYNKKMYGDAYDKYALELPEERYTIDDWSIKLFPDVNTPYSLFPIRVNIDGLLPEDKYFIPLKIASVSDYMVSTKRRNVMLQVFMKNDYATTKKLTYYNMEGTTQQVKADTWEPMNNAPTPINATKSIVPIAEQGIRILPGYNSTVDSKELRKQGIAVTVHPEELIDIPIIGDDGLATGKYMKCQRVTLEKWFDIQDAINVVNIEDNPSYYNPETHEFILHYRYSYKSNQWFEMKEVMTPLDITNN